MLVLGTVFGGVTTTLGATAPDVPGDQSLASEELRQDQSVANTSVTFENQTSNGTVVTVSQVNLTEGGFVVIHDEGLLEGSVLGSVRGVSQFLEPGSYDEVRVTLDEPINESRRLLALAYRDTNDNQNFDFVESQGADDSAYTVDNQVVGDDATVTVEEVEAATEETTTEEEPEETTTEEPPETTTEAPPETSTEEPPETTTEAPPETLTEEPPGTTTEAPPETPTEEPPETTTEAPPETLTEEPPETTTEELPETTTEEPPETTTEAPPQTTTAEEAEETTTEESAETPTEVSVTFENQTSNGTVVTISQASLPDGGFVVIHDASLLDGSVAESVRGVSQFLEPGTHEEIRVTLDEPIAESQRLIALAYRDTDDDQTFDFVESQGETDTPYTVDDQVVVDVATVTVEEDEEEVETTTPEEVETTTDVPPETETTETPTETTETPTEATETPTETETTTEVVEEPVAEQTFRFRIDNLQIQEFSVVAGDPDDVDRTVVVEDVSVSDRTVRVDLTKILSGAAPEEAVGEAANDAQQIAAADVQDVRFVFRNVTVQNVEFVVTAPKGVEFDLPDEMMPETTTTEEPTETTTTEEPAETTPTAEEPTETTTGEAPAETTTTEEAEPTETTTEEAEPTETTTEEAEPTEITAEEETPEEPSLRVPALDAPGTIVLDGSDLVVNARVSNPSDQLVTDIVELRVDGDLVAERRVELDPGETVQVRYTVSTADLDLEPGQAFIDVLTTDFGKSIEVTVRDGPPEDDEEGDESN